MKRKLVYSSTGKKIGFYKSKRSIILTDWNRKKFPVRMFIKKGKKLISAE